MARERGAVAVELSGAIALLLVPVVCLVAALPVWAERRHAAVVTAREAARVAVRDYPLSSPDDAAHVATFVAANYGVDADQVDVVFDRFEVVRGGTVTARVTVEMPALWVPGLGALGRWTYETTATRRIDDYRSR